MMRVRLVRRNDTFLFFVLLSHILHLSSSSELSRHLCLRDSVFYLSDLSACMASFGVCSEVTGPSPVHLSLEGNDTTIESYMYTEI